MKKTQKQIDKKFQEELRDSRVFAKPGKHSLVLILDHLKPDFNVGKILRTAEFFNLESIYLWGVGQFDPYIAKGAMRHIPVYISESKEDFLLPLMEQGFSFFALDLSAKTELTNIKFPKKTALILGHEEFGVTKELLEHEWVHPLKISGFGKTQSLNVSIAAAIASFEYIRQQQVP
jgi:tRNA G18 (ribose-2'-O)-methylase SpoU